MINYKAIWDSINEESKKNVLKPLIIRRIKSDGACNVFLATDYGKGIRLLYVNVSSDQSVSIEDLPRFKGLEITSLIQDVGGFKNSRFIKFSQIMPNSDAIFESVIADICDKILKVQNEENLAEALQKVLSEWKFFFEKQEDKVLSVSRQKGLVGELYFLRDFLFKKYSFSDAVSYWTGADRANHDFQLSTIAVEIKTTSSKQHKKFMVSSEKQLDNAGLSHLYLVLYSFGIHTHQELTNLPTIINSVLVLMQDDPVTQYYFDIQLIKYGYNRQYSDRYKVGFSLTDIKSFEVSEGFPRMTQSNLPEGTGDLKYSVIVAACKDFKVNEDLLNLL